MITIILCSKKTEERPITSMLFLLDTSLSMGENQALPLHQVKTFIKERIHKSRAGDRIIIFTFDEQVELLMDATLMNGKHNSQLLEQVDQIELKGKWTWIREALETASQFMLSLKDTSALQSIEVYLLTDGKNDPPPESNESQVNFKELINQYFKDYYSSSDHIYVLELESVTSMTGLPVQPHREEITEQIKEKVPKVQQVQKESTVVQKQLKAEPAIQENPVQKAATEQAKIKIVEYKPEATNEEVKQSQEEKSVKETAIKKGEIKLAPNKFILDSLEYTVKNREICITVDELKNPSGNKISVQLSLSKFISMEDSTDLSKDSLQVSLKPMQIKIKNQSQNIPLQLNFRNLPNGGQYKGEIVLEMSEMADIDRKTIPVEIYIQPREFKPTFYQMLAATGIFTKRNVLLCLIILFSIVSLYLFFKWMILPKVTVWIEGENNSTIVPVTVNKWKKSFLTKLGIPNYYLIMDRYRNKTIYIGETINHSIRFLKNGQMLPCLLPSGKKNYFVFHFLFPGQR